MTHVSPAALAAAWDAWSPRRGGVKLGVGPGFREAVEAAVAVVVAESSVVASAEHLQALETVSLYALELTGLEETVHHLRARVRALEDENERLGHDVSSLQDQVDALTDSATY